MTISGTIEQAPINAYYFTDVASNDVVFRGFGNASFAFGTGSNVLSSLRINSNIITMSANALGLGTSSPQGIFHMFNSNSSPIMLLDGGGAGNRGVLRMSATNTGNYIQSGSLLSNDSKADVVFSSMMGTTEWMRVQSSTGKVGIGSTNPQYTLDTVGNARFTTGMTTPTVSLSNITSTGSISIGCDSNTSTINIGVASNAQTINIGTNATAVSTINIGGPGDTVNITGTLEYVNTTNMTVTNKVITLNQGGSAGTATGAGFQIQEGGTNTAYIRTSTDRNSFVFRTPNAPSDLTMDMSTGGLNINTNSLYLTSNGQVGIGTNSPQTTFHVSGGLYGSAYYLAQPGGTQATVPWSTSKMPYYGVGFGTTDGSVNLSGSSNVNISSLGTAGTVNVYTNVSTGGTNNTPKMTVLPNGNVGIGTSNPLTKLSVYRPSGGLSMQVATAVTVGEIALAGSAGDYSTWANTNDVVVRNLYGSNIFIQNGSGNAAIAINSNNNVGIGTSTPAQALDVNGGAVLRNGNTPSVSTNTQMQFAYLNTGNYTHAIKSRHTSTDSTGNAIDFYVWQQSQGLTAVGSKQVMSITSTGVGIYTSNPQYGLDVNGTVNASNIYMNGMPIAIGSFWFQSMGGNWSACNVAIGSSSNPLYPLTVSGPGQFTGATSISATQSGAYINWNNDGGSGRTQFINNRGGGTGGFQFDLYTASGYSNTAVLINGNGNVGIGTSGPAAKLHVVIPNSNVSIMVGTSNATAELALANGPAQYTTWAQSNDVVLRNNSGSNMYLQVGGGTAGICIGSNNNVGIGKSQPAFPLDVVGIARVNSTVGAVSWTYGDGLVVSGASYGACEVHIEGVGPGSGWYGIIQGCINSNAGSNFFGYCPMVINPQGGNVGIGKTNPGYTLDVNGSVNVSSSFKINGTSLASSATVDTTNAANISSGTLAVARLPTGIPNTNISGLSTSATTDTTNAGNISSGTLAVARGGTGTSTSTGSGSVVLSTSPSLSGTVTATSYNEGGVLLGSKYALSNTLQSFSNFVVPLATSGFATGSGLTYTSCNVGIGTTNPQCTLQASGTTFLGSSAGVGLTAGGAYQYIKATYDSATTTHAITPNNLNASWDNAAGFLMVYTKNTSSTNPKSGCLLISWVKQWGTATNMSIVNTNKTSSLSTFGASNNNNAITIFTDSDCAVTYNTFGGC